MYYNIHKSRLRTTDFLRNFFMANIIYSHNNTFCILFWCMASGLNPGFTSNKPIHYLLDYGDWQSIIIISYKIKIFVLLTRCFSYFFELQITAITTAIQREQYYSECKPVNIINLMSCFLLYLLNCRWLSSDHFCQIFLFFLCCIVPVAKYNLFS